MFHLAIVETVISLLTAGLAAGGLPALFGLMAWESVGIPPLPGEVILLFAGFLVASGTFSLPVAAVAAVSGSLVGSFVGYGIGRYGRRFISEDAPSWRRIDPKHLAAMDRWFERWGEEAVAFIRLLPIVRSYVSYPAGTARMSPPKFGLYTLLGATPFEVTILYAGSVLGSNWREVVPWFNLLDYVAIAMLLAIPIYIALRWRGLIEPGFPPRFSQKAETGPGNPPPGN
jgi:membrane protein DedA with SNARE-associated domain